MPPTSHRQEPQSPCSLNMRMKDLGRAKVTWAAVVWLNGARFRVPQSLHPCEQNPRHSQETEDPWTFSWILRD